MPIIDDLLASVNDDAPVQDLLIGLHWTTVYSKQIRMPREKPPCNFGAWKTNRSRAGGLRRCTMVRKS